MAAMENGEMLTLDALNGEAPGLLGVVGTSVATLDLRGFQRAREFVFRALRRRWPAVEYAYLLEYTLGLSDRSHGRRFPHWNLPIKGVPPQDYEEARTVIIEAWCRNCPGARPLAQYVAPMRAVGGFVRYVFDHFRKIDQRPPAGFRGRRFGTSRGYLWIPAADARKVARESLAGKRALWKARQALGHDAPSELLELEAASIRAEADSLAWDLVNVVEVAGLIVDVRTLDGPRRTRSWRPSGAATS